MIAILFAYALQSGPAVMPPPIPKEAVPARDVTVMCGFARFEGEKFIASDNFAAFMPNGLKTGSAKDVEVLDPSGLMRGDRFESSLDSGDSFSIAGPKEADPRMLLYVSFKPAESPGDSNAAIGAIGEKKPRQGRCRFLAGPKSKAAFADWKANPEKFANKPW